MSQKFDLEKNMFYGAPICAEHESEHRLFLKIFSAELHSKNLPLLAPKMPLFALYLPGTQVYSQQCIYFSYIQKTLYKLVHSNRIEIHALKSWNFESHPKTHNSPRKNPWLKCPPSEMFRTLMPSNNTSTPKSFPPKNFTL